MSRADSVTVQNRDGLSNPPHLHCCWDYYSAWYSGSLREDICKVESVRLSDHQSPEAIADIQFTEQDVQPCWCVSHVLEEPREHLPNLLDWD